MRAREKARTRRDALRSAIYHLNEYRSARRKIAHLATTGQPIPASCPAAAELGFHAVGLAEEIDRAELAGSIT